MNDFGVWSASFSFPKSLDSELHIPTCLSVTQVVPKRVLVIGGCFSEYVAHNVHRTIPGCEQDFVLYNGGGGQLPPLSRSISEYDFIVVIPPLRSAMPDGGYIRLPYDRSDLFEAFFEDSVSRLQQLIGGALGYTRQYGKTTFVLNFITPQGGYMGRLLPKNDLRNPHFFGARLNEELEKLIKSEQATYLVDLDELACSLGKRWLNDDTVVVSSHGSFIGDWVAANDEGRLEKPLSITDQFQFMHPLDFVSYIWRELVACYRIVRQADAIKLVVTDLDDTLWRGVAIEREGIDLSLTEGWPLGYVEALHIVKRRGLLLAVLSKNDRSKIEQIWPSIWRGLIDLNDFAAVKINWDPKVKNMEELLREVNLLPQSVLYIDDNPVERAAMQAAFPEMRIIGSNPYEFRRLLLWAPETQVPIVTGESAQRTQMVQAQVERERVRAQMSREDFLATLGVRMKLSKLDGTADQKFPRAFELLNKTNQFNTTGKRWKHEEMMETLNTGGRLYVFEVEDQYTAYGLVGVIVETHGVLQQFVMSCRTLGLDVERAAIGGVAEDLRLDGIEGLSAVFVETPSNQVCRDIWHKTGFERADDGYWRARCADVPGVPEHILMSEPAIAYSFARMPASARSR
jgi:FkbH-like protein